MTHTARNFEHLIGNVKGLSEKQLRAHFGLYEGYVKKINEIESKLKDVDLDTANYSFGDVSELLRRQSVPYNGAYLHELYFENLTGKKSEPAPELLRHLENSYGSMENWLHHTKAGLTSAHGWVLLVRSKKDGRLRNDLIEEHHRGVMVEQDVLLALDGWEHAYMIDYGTSKKDYIQVLEKSIDWSIVNLRFEYSIRTQKMAA
jgi:Fe-Mn family superoxide dismutase